MYISARHGDALPGDPWRNSVNLRIVVFDTILVAHWQLPGVRQGRSELEFEH